MLETLLCSLITILPDYLFRRYVQGKRIGREITFYSVWYELRWGIISCLILTISLIAMIFYYHPSTSNAVAAYRTVPILPETRGRVQEVFLEPGLVRKVKAGDPIFRLDSSQQQAALETARRKVAEIDASMAVAKAELDAAEAQLRQSRASLKQATDDLETKLELQRRNANVVTTREIERLQNIVDSRKGGVDAATANKKNVETQINVLLPAQKASAEAARAQAEVDLSKTLVVAGTDGTVEQFSLRVGDVVNPMMRPAGILVPDDAGRYGVIAGFGQLEAQVIHPGMIAEVTCISKPFTVIPMVVTDVQMHIAAGQLGATTQLLESANAQPPGAITAKLEPLYEGGFAGVPPGSSCSAVAYTSNHKRLASGDAGFLEGLFLHMVDTVAVLPAAILRSKALRLPIQTLVLSGH
ncbi:HlyD family secretion protein [Rhodobium gokarnense]|uniref:Multidrug resistance efflux pump n=1 Tax=Rhodobium gokarnense TaxID=364296 RepID=A0ABT3H8F0_9HYPH|nr:HlyD family secretion protein [Rhodobium gokarnense]MCW2306586.1 multidrug resistance efflux pump [Rhodobium gokarnense]